MQNMHYRPRRHIAWACLAEMRMCGTQEAQNFGPICLPWSHLLASPGALYESKRHSRSTSTAQSMQLRSPRKKQPTHATNKCICSVQQLSYDGAYLLYVLVWPRMGYAKVTCSSRDTSANFMLWWRRNWLSNLLVETWQWWPGRWRLKMPTTDFLSKCFQGGRSCFKTEPDLRWEHIPGVWNSVPSCEGTCDHDDIWMQADSVWQVQLAELDCKERECSQVVKTFWLGVKDQNICLTGCQQAGISARLDIY